MNSKTLVVAWLIGGWPSPSALNRHPWCGLPKAISARSNERANDHVAAAPLPHAYDGCPADDAGCCRRVGRPASGRAGIRRVLHATTASDGQSHSPHVGQQGGALRFPRQISTPEARRYYFSGGFFLASRKSNHAQHTLFYFRRRPGAQRPCKQSSSRVASSVGAQLKHRERDRPLAPTAKPRRRTI